MSDVVVTVPKDRWSAWLEEGDLAPKSNRFRPLRTPSEALWEMRFGGTRLPDIRPGERVYIVSHGCLRGFAPLVSLESDRVDSWALIRGRGAVALTIDEEIPGFRGFRYRWWTRASEVPFPDWRSWGVASASPFVGLYQLAEVHTSNDLVE